MASRKPNMLEAFQHSARVAQSAREEQEKAAHLAEAESPAKRAPAPEPAAQHETSLFTQDLLGTRPRPRPGFPIWLPLGIIVLLAAMAGTYWVTRNLGRTTEAGNTGNGGNLSEEVESDLRALSGTSGANSSGATDSQGNSAEGDHTPGSSLDNAEAPLEVESALSEADKRFMDKQNRFTVRAIQYPNDKRGSRFAMLAYEHLRAAGLPAVTPVTMKDIVVVCVGAEPKLGGQLDQIKTRLQDLAGPPPQNEPGAFRGAFDVNIDDYINR